MLAVSGRQSGDGRRWLVLALIVEQPSHGYEIAKRYESRFGWFAQMTSSGVYAALAQLHESGLVEEIELETSGQAPRKRAWRRNYRATADGVRAYRVWVAERMGQDAWQSELLERVASVGILGVSGLIEVVERHQQDCLAAMREMPRRDADRVPEGGVPELASWLATDQQRRALDARLAWTVDALEVLRAYASRRNGSRVSR